MYVRQRVTLQVPLLFCQTVPFCRACSRRVFSARVIHFVPPVSPSSPVWALNQLMVSRSRSKVMYSVRPASRSAWRLRAAFAASGKSSSVDLALAQSSSVHSASSGFSAIWRGDFCLLFRGVAARSYWSSRSYRAISLLLAFLRLTILVNGSLGVQTIWYSLWSMSLREVNLVSPPRSCLWWGGSGPVYPVGESEVESSLSERFLALVFVPLVWRAGRWSHIDPVWLFTLSSESSRRVGSGLDFRLREVAWLQTICCAEKSFLSASWHLLCNARRR